MKMKFANAAFCLAAFLACSAPGFAQKASPKTSTAGASAEPGAYCPMPNSAARAANRPMAIVDGQPIYRSDLPAATQARLLKLRQQEYQAESGALQTLIDQKVVEAEAKKKGVTVDQLYKQHVVSKIQSPSTAEARGYYLAVRSHTTLPFSQIEPQVIRFLRNQEIEQGRQKYVEKLRGNTNVSVLLQPPVVDFGKNDPARIEGNPKAPITIVEFGDFECPFCGRVEPTLMALLKKYKGKVRLAFRDFPLTAIHPYAHIAAEASRCAEAQGKFWPMHDAMYANQSKLTEPDLVETAGRTGLDVKSFSACLKSGKYDAAIQQDEADGTRAGVTGTPSFFINGRFLSGAMPEAQFEQIIDAELAGLKKQGPAVASR